MPNEPRPADPAPLTDEQIRAHTVGPLQPLAGRIVIVEYDPAWPALFAREADRIRAVLGRGVAQIEHTGSTAVPGLAAKPTIDILLVVTDSADEDAYLPDLVAAGYALRIREPDWHEHRMLKGPDTDINLHVLSAGCSEIERLVRFRNWLRRNDRDRDRYARQKRALAERDWPYVQNYADAKAPLIEEILARAIGCGAAPPVTS